ncbi:Gfo/Idh/MocA family protein [Paenibacillus camelliae]|uniref:Gfo/Idh/MocA family protein n=1 Tax=Paenibacillus camelliae TaxID=512410 RepID=UPI00203E3D8E|nr:Gfo/Idh/MocA family oxidoreductase [Paenibacillus camelliae]MCM3635377.1 Gfo/Idh/MocA family oxidoreductase [Paenibacillus camelliae]
MSNQKIRWGVLGCASIAKRSVVPGIQGSQLNEVRAIASRSLEKSLETAKELNIPVAYGSYEELINDQELDAIYIPLPNQLHKEWTIKAMKAGKHVLCEKPIALTHKEAEEMLLVSKEMGVIVAEAFMYRYHPRYERIKQLIADGAIGDLRLIKGSFTFNNGDSTDNVRFVKEWGGGSLYDVGCYPISAARYFLDREPIAATMQAMFSEKHGGVDMMAAGLVEFPGDVSLLFDCGMWAAFRNPMEILGTKGRIEIPHAFLGKNENEGNYYLHTDQGVEEMKAESLDTYSLQADAFARAIYGEQPLPFPLEDAIANMKVLEACLQSAENGTRVTLNG